MHDGGFIKLNRQILDWRWYSDKNVRVVFIHCLLRANYITRRWQGIELLPGQFVTSYQNFSEECGLSVHKIRLALEKLQSTNEITLKTSNKYTIVSVTNWNKWQAKD